VAGEGVGSWVRSLFNKFGLRVSFGDASSSVFARWFCFSSGSYSYPYLRPQSQQQFDQCDQVEEELGRAQSNASSSYLFNAANRA